MDCPYDCIGRIKDWHDMQIDIQKYTLDFRFDAGTSRGVMKSKDSYFIKLWHPQNPEVFGLGECGPLNGLSPDLVHGFQGVLDHSVREISQKETLVLSDVFSVISDDFPAMQFALETAIMDLQNGGKRELYQNGFTDSTQSIPINGLVWMGDKKLMLERIQQKINEGFSCIKIKIGAINFEDELDLLRYLRRNFSSDEITIRLDANGAFAPEDALKKLEQLARFDVHSIEQPIMAGNWQSMEKLCFSSPIPIALDEELIGISGKDNKHNLLEQIKPQYIILKPTLLGGLQRSKEWIDLAAKSGIGWWITSALESNIGLNAIAQFTANYPVELPQGLGTGQLFYNNIPSPLVMEKGRLSYDKSMLWGLSGTID